MLQTFWAEIKSIFKSKRKIFAYVLALFIPFTYGFLYLNAYWAPFKHVSDLKIAVVSRDRTTSSTTPSEKLISSITGKDGINVGDQHYSIYEDESIKDDPEAAVNSGKYSAVIVIPNGYNQYMHDFFDGFIAGALLDNLNLVKLEEDMSKGILQKETETYGADKAYDRLTFYNSYKNNYLAGEMTNFLAGSFELVMKRVLAGIDISSISPTLARVVSSVNAATIMPKITHAIDQLKSHDTKDSPILLEKTTHGRVNTYGFGLSPYFISIGLFAGALVMVFIIKNERHIKSVGTVKHYLGKWLFWVLSGAIQSVILITAVTLQGVNIGMDQWMLFIFAMFMAVIFATIVQAIMFAVRYSDLGEFAVVILLILQLISSSGTFPVEMQHQIFKVIHPVVPFTYTVEAIRETFYDPSWQIIMKDVGILLLFPIVLVPISMFINYRFDKKTVKNIKGNKVYQSFEIHLGDY